MTSSKNVIIYYLFRYNEQRYSVLQAPYSIAYVECDLSGSPDFQFAPASSFAGSKCFAPKLKPRARPKHVSKRLLSKSPFLPFETDLTLSPGAPPLSRIRNRYEDTENTWGGGGSVETGRWRRAHLWLPLCWATDARTQCPHWVGGEQDVGREGCRT